MWFKAEKPKYDEVDHEYVVPLRLSEQLTHDMLSGWTPFGIGWAKLRPRTDGSFDLFLRSALVREDMNIIRLDAVQQSLMAALDLALKIEDESSLLSEETVTAAKEVVSLVQAAAK